MMRLRAAADWCRLTAACLLAFSAALGGLAHAPGNDPRSPSALIAYAMPDGSLPELCVGHADEPAKGDAKHAVCVLACVMAVPGGLCPVAAGVEVPASVAWRADPTLSTGSRPRPIWSAARARAPPTIA
jgi:hypothetical protein